MTDLTNDTGAYSTGASVSVLILPGWQGSGPGHWQMQWARLYGYTVVEQNDWLHPLRGDWLARLDEVVIDAPGPVVLVAHSLGCILTAACGWPRQMRRFRVSLQNSEVGQ